jgi:hypothetical protein
MKNILIFSLASLLLIGGCASGIHTLSKGLENEAFLEFIGNPNDYKEGVNVTIDKKTTFKAEVNKVRKSTKAPKGNLYAISPGKHIVVVSYNNNIIVKKQIFVSSQETKQIILP